MRYSRRENSYQEKPQDSRNPAALTGNLQALGSVDNDVINHSQIAHIRVINTHVSTGLDRGSDHFAVLVEDVTRSVKYVATCSIRTILANNESLVRLIIGRRPFLSCHFEYRSCYRYSFCRG